MCTIKGPILVHISFFGNSEVKVLRQIFSSFVVQFVEILRESEISFIHNDCVLGQSKCFLSRFGYYGKLKRASLHRVSVLFWRPRPETSCYSCKGSQFIALEY